MLAPNGPLPPFASRGSDTTKPYRQMHLSYGDSKLAQVLHMHALNRRLGQKNSKVQVSAEEGQTNPPLTNTPLFGARVQAVAFCPAWAATGIAPEGIARAVMGALAHPIEQSIHGLIHAVLHPDVKAGDFVGNTNIVSYLPFKEHWLLSPLHWNGFHLRDNLVDSFAMIMMLVQKFNFGAFVQDTSPESKDEQLQEKLYEWSMGAVREWL